MFKDLDWRPGMGLKIIETEYLSLLIKKNKDDSSLSELQSSA